MRPGMRAADRTGCWLGSCVEVEADNAGLVVLGLDLCLDIEFVDACERDDVVVLVKDVSIGLGFFGAKVRDDIDGGAELSMF